MIAASRTRIEAPHSAFPTRPLSVIERVTAGLEIVLGLGALAGGGLLVAAPDGHLLGMPATTLAGTPFTSFLVPGALLFAFNGVLPMVAAAATLRRMAIAPRLAILVGITLVTWISTEMVLLAGLGSLAWAFYLLLGGCIAALGIARWRNA
jgi:hypothetical protein